MLPPCQGAPHPCQGAPFGSGAAVFAADDVGCPGRSTGEDAAPSSRSPITSGVMCSPTGPLAPRLGWSCSTDPGHPGAPGEPRCRDTPVSGLGRASWCIRLSVHTLGHRHSQCHQPTGLPAPRYTSKLLISIINSGAMPSVSCASEVTPEQRGGGCPGPVHAPLASPTHVSQQVVVLRDPMEDPDDVLRASRSRQKSYIFDVAFDSTATQVGA